MSPPHARARADAPRRPQVLWPKRLTALMYKPVRDAHAATEGQRPRARMGGAPTPQPTAARSALQTRKLRLASAMSSHDCMHTSACTSVERPASPVGMLASTVEACGTIFYHTTRSHGLASEAWARETNTTPPDRLPIDTRSCARWVGRSRVPFLPSLLRALRGC